MNKDMVLIDLCDSILRNPKITAQIGWRKLIIIAEVDVGLVGVRCYSYDSEGNYQAVSPGISDSNKPSILDKIKDLHTLMKQENPTGRGWLKCMLRMSREGELGVDFEYDDPDRWSHTVDNYEERIKEYAALPV